MADARTLLAKKSEEEKLQEEFPLPGLTALLAWPLAKKVVRHSCCVCCRGTPQSGIKLSDVCFGEGPRFHEGRLFFSDMHMGEIISLDPSVPGSASVTKVDFDPSGLGWLPDGRMVAVAMKELAVYVQQAHGAFELYSDLSALSAFKCNDMCVAGDGTLYVGNFGFNLEEAVAALKGFKDTTLVQVRPDGQTSLAAKGMRFPNGSVITPDGKTLIVAETFAQRLTAFTIREDGSLADRRIWAEVSGLPDGICLDADGCVWYASPQAGLFFKRGGFVRVKEGGEILQTIGFADWPEGRQGIACVLGTVAGQHKLFVTEAGGTDPEKTGLLGKKNGSVWMFDAPAGPAKRQGDPRYNAGYC